MFAPDNEQISQRLVAQLAERGNSRCFERGEVLFVEGEQSDALYILLEGELKVFTRSDTRRELVFGVLHPGEFIGELLLDGGPRPVSVRAACPSRCVVVDSEQFRDFLRSYPEFAECLVLRLIKRVRHATDQLRGLVMKDVYERVATLLDSLAVREGALRTLDKGITQQEIADRIGATREMVNHIFRELTRGGFLTRIDDRRIALCKELPKHW